jgi:hypothetical protein
VRQLAAGSLVEREFEQERLILRRHGGDNLRPDAMPVTTRTVGRRTAPTSSDVDEHSSDDEPSRCRSTAIDRPSGDQRR